MSLKMITVAGDLLNNDCDVIIQQCNCVTIKAHGLSDDIKKKYPYADLYGNRPRRSSNTSSKYDTPGTCHLLHPPAESSGPIVACLMGQFYPGKPGNYWRRAYNSSTDDSAANRLKWFASALADLAEQLKGQAVRSVAFPFRIGCGLGGGRWDKYQELLADFLIAVPELDVKIYRKD